MIRFLILSVIAGLMLLIGMGGLVGSFGGVAFLAVCVAAFGLFISLCTDLRRQA